MMNRTWLVATLLIGLTVPVAVANQDVPDFEIIITPWDSPADYELAKYLAQMPCGSLTTKIDENNENFLIGIVRMEFATWRLLNHNMEMPLQVAESVTMLCSHMPDFTISQAVQDISNTGVYGNLD